MSSNAHIRSHRKPRSSSRNSLIRTGVTGGVLTTLAVTGAAGSANATVKSEAAAETAEIPTLGSTLATGTTQAAYATQSLAIQYELDAAQTDARNKAKKAAAKEKKKADDEAKRKAAAAKARAEAERAAEAPATRSSKRTTLGSDSGTSDESSTSTATGSAAAVVEFAKAQVGKAYVMGSTGPNAYDCSGLTTAAFKQVGVDLPRVSQDQSTFGTEVGLNNLQPGDILYWGGKGTAYHVAIYIGGGQYVGAQNPSTGVAQHPLDWGGTPSGAIRVL
jgi:peptidoglycan DL-endopeptidase CwlO